MRREKRRVAHSCKNCVSETGPDRIAVAAKLQVHGVSCTSSCRLVCSMQTPVSSRLNGNGPGVRARARRRRNFCARAARRGRDDIGKAEAVLTVCEQPTLQTCISLPEHAMRTRERAGDLCLENVRFGICSIGLGSGVSRCRACSLARALRQMPMMSKPQARQQGMLEQRRKQEACMCLGRSYCQT